LREAGTRAAPQSGMNIAIVGCGYVAEFYGKTLRNYPNLTLVGAYDRNAANLLTFCQRWSAKPCGSLEQLVGDASVQLVLNLTNPRSHYEVTKRCIEAGKHVYSEKPLAMDSEKASELVHLAENRGVYLACAPCSVLGDTAQAVWKAIRENVIGRVRLVYASFDDGMIAPKHSPWLWQNESGVPWPAKDEFEIGCTYEHAGYILTWLGAFFGPALNVTSFASCLLRDKGIAVESMAPDLTVGCIEYDNGVVARITCSLVAPKDKSLTIIGDDGVLSVADVRDDRCPVYLRKIPSTGWRHAIERRLNGVRRSCRFPGSSTDWHFWERYRFIKSPPRVLVSQDKPVDFCRGPAELADAIQSRRPCRLSAQLGWHITELIETLQYPERFGFRRKLASSFDAIQPLRQTA
jgi:predicted dehydrogenase